MHLKKLDNLVQMPLLVSTKQETARKRKDQRKEIFFLETIKWKIKLGGKKNEKNKKREQMRREKRKSKRREIRKKQERKKTKVSYFSPHFSCSGPIIYSQIFPAFYELMMDGFDEWTLFGTHSPWDYVYACTTNDAVLSFLFFFSCYFFFSSSWFDFFLSFFFCILFSFRLLFFFVSFLWFVCSVSFLFKVSNHVQLQFNTSVTQIKNNKKIENKPYFRVCAFFCAGIT